MLEHTFELSLLTKTSRPSLEMLAGKLTAGASGFPSSSDTNWTTTLGEGATGSGSGCGTPWYTLIRLGGGNSVAMIKRLEVVAVRPKIIIIILIT